jgi:hypothetical protein
MHCSDVKQRLQQATTSATITADSELMAHLKTCKPCHDYAQELRLTRLLASTPVPAMREGFADQALARAWEVGQHQQAARPIRSFATVSYAVAGMAASLLLGILLVSQWGTISTPVVQPATIAQVEVAPAATREVQVRLVSKEALPDAIITIQLEGDVALTGYPGTQTLRWQTAIAAGNNQMALPISLKGNSALGGVISIEVRSGNASKMLHFTVQPGTSLAALNPVYLANI